MKRGRYTDEEFTEEWNEEDFEESWHDDEFTDEWEDEGIEVEGEEFFYPEDTWEEASLEELTEDEADEITGGASLNYGTTTVYVSAGRSGVTLYPNIGGNRSSSVVSTTLKITTVRGLSSVRVDRKNVRTTGNCTIKVNGYNGYKYYRIYFK